MSSGPGPAQEAAPAAAAPEAAPAGPEGASGAFGATARRRPRLMTPAHALAMQGAVGNAAVGRALQRQPKTAPKPGDKPDEDEPHLPPGRAWVVPLTGNKDKILADAMAAVGDMTLGEANQKELIGSAMYFVITDKLYRYDHQGVAKESWALKRGAKTPPPGFFLSTPGIPAWRRMYASDDPFRPVGFEQWTTKSNYNMDQWLADGEKGRDQVAAAMSGAQAVILAVGPLGGTKPGPPPEWAQKLVKSVQEKIGTLKGGKKPNDPTKPPGEPPKPGDPPPPPAPPPPRDLPDGLIPFSLGDEVKLQINADQASKTIPLNPKLTPEELLELIKKQVEQLKKERDPESSQTLVKPTDKEGFTTDPKKELKLESTGPRLRDPSDPDAPAGTGKGNANYPPYPASMIMVGASPQDSAEGITVMGATNRFSMQLLFSAGGMNSINLITNQAQRIQYYWELLEVTGVEGDEQARVKAAREKAKGMAAGDEANKASHGELNDVKRKRQQTLEDTEKNLAELGETPWPMRAQQLQLIGLSVGIRELAGWKDAFISRVASPLNDKTIGFPKEGEYVVRCVATPQTAPDDPVRRASSIAVRAVRVMSVRARAQEADKEEDTRLSELEGQKEKPPAWTTKAQVEEEIAELKKLQAGGHTENTEFLLEKASKQIAIANELKDADAQRLPKTQRSAEARWLKVRLDSRNVLIDDYIAETQRRQKQLIEMRGRLQGFGSKRKSGEPLYSPRVTLASEENGVAYKLIMTLAQTKSKAEDKKCEFRLADVTMKDSQQEYLGFSEKDGIEGEREAARNAFVRFREANEYGRGTIVIRLPEDLKKRLGADAIESEMRSAKGRHERAIQLLTDLATAAEIAGMIVGGPAGMAIGIAGGIAGAAVAVDSMAKRSSGDRLHADFETTMDIISVAAGAIAVVGGVATVVGEAAQMAGAAGKAAQSATRVANAEAWAKRAKIVGDTVHIIGKGQLLGQVVIVPYAYLHALAKIEEAAAKEVPPPTEGELALRRAEAFSQFAWGVFTTSVSAAQMMGMKSLVGENEPGPAKQGKTEEKPSGQPDVAPQAPKKLDVPDVKAPPPAAKQGPTAPAEAPGAGKAGTPPPPGAPPPTGAAPPPTGGPQPAHRVIKANEFGMAVDMAVGKRGEGTPRAGRLSLVDGAILDDVHMQVTGKPTPEGAIGLFDPATGTFYLRSDALTPERQASLAKLVDQRMSRFAMEQLGPSLSAGFREHMVRVVLEGIALPEPAGRAPRRVTGRLIELIGPETIARALFENDIKGVRNALEDRFGPARAKAIEQALRAGRDFDAILLLDDPNHALANTLGSYFADGVVDLISQSRGGQPTNPERARIAAKIAEKVGLDVMRAALLQGEVAPLQEALARAMGPEPANALSLALTHGDIPAVKKALGEPVKTPAAEAAKPAAAPAKGAPEPNVPAKRALPEPRPPEQALATALKAGGKPEAHVDAATAYIKDAGNFKDIRAAVESGRLGDPKAAEAAVQHARRVITDQALEGVVAKLKEEHPDLNVKLSDLGTPGFGSDRDVTIKVEPKPGTKATTTDAVARSVEAVRDTYAALEKAGYPPDAALDSNFYTELHEGRIEPRSAQERSAISADQSVVSMAEMRMNMSDDQWNAYKQKQLESAGPAERGPGAAGELGAEARARIAAQLGAAEALSGQLKAGKPAEVRAKVEGDLLAALKKEPIDPREVRSLMGKLKLLEPDAYGTRAAVEDVVDFQQALARAESDAGTGPILKGKPGRLGERGVPIHEELATVTQVASASNAKLSHVHGDTPAHAASASKYLARVLQAFREAGLSINDPLIAKTGQVVGSKAEGSTGIMRELRSWADATGRTQLKTDAELVTAYVKACQDLGIDITVRLRTAEATAAAQHSLMGGDTPTGGRSDPDAALAAAMKDPPPPGGPAQGTAGPTPAGGPPPATAGPATPATTHTPAAPAAPLTPAQVRQKAADRADAFRTRYSKVDGSATSMAALTELFERAGGLTQTAATAPTPGQYVPMHTRTASAELKTIIAHAERPEVVRVELIPHSSAGRTCDLVLHERQPDGTTVPVRVEITTVTGTQVGRADIGAGGMRETRVADITRVVREKAAPKGKVSQLAAPMPGVPVGGDLAIHLPHVGDGPADVAAAMGRIAAEATAWTHVRAIDFFLPGGEVIRYERGPLGTYTRVP